MHETTKAILAGMAYFSCTLPAVAGAQVSTTFDFETPAGDQEGEYRPEEGAEVAEGVGRLGLRPGWADETLTVRAKLDVTNEGAATDDAVVDIPGRILPTEFRDRVSGTNVVVADDEGALFDAMFAGTELARGRIRARVSRLPRGPSALYVYAGAADPLSTDELAFFTGDGPLQLPVLGGAFGSPAIRVTSLISDNMLTDATGSTTLGMLESTTIGEANAGAALELDGPAQITWTGGNGDAMPTPAFVGRTFVTPAPRYDERLEVYAFEDTTVSFANPPIGDVDVAAGTSTLINTPTPDNEVISFEASAPILAMRAGDTNDVTLLAPAGTELFGVATGTMLVATGDAEASVTVYGSDGTGALVVPPNVVIPVTTGSMGSGEAVRLVSDQPIGAVSYADGDGAEMIALLPPENMGTRFALEETAQYVAIATETPDVECALFDAGGAEVSRQTSTGAEPQSAGRILFGSGTQGANVSAPAMVQCDAAAWAMFEPALTDTEKLLVAAANHRAGAGPVRLQPAEVETARAENAAVVTPTWRPAVPVERLTRFDVVAEGEPRFQVSFDGGLTWRVPRDGSFVEAVPTSVEAAGAFVDVPFQSTRSITLRAWLEGDDASIDEITLVAPGDLPGDAGTGAPDAGGDAGAFGDTGERGGTTPKDGGCGCSSGSTPAGSLLLLFLFAGLLRHPFRRR